MGAELELRDRVIAAQSQLAIELKPVKARVSSDSGVIEQILEIIERCVRNALAAK